jgi:hypothetical protein
MAALNRALGRVDPVTIVLRAGIVALTLATAYIHSTLGGMLFTLNALGYAALAVAMIVPISFVAQRRLVVRLALAGFTAMTIVGYLLIGPYFQLGFITKGIEVALLAVLAVDTFRTHGGPVSIARELRDIAVDAFALVTRRERPGLANA